MTPRAGIVAALTADITRRAPYSIDEYERAYDSEQKKRAPIETVGHICANGTRITVTGRDLKFTESSQLGSEATAPAGDPSQPPSSEAAAGETGGGCNDSILRDGLVVGCVRPRGHRGDHHNAWSGWRWPPHPLYVSP